MDGRKSIKEIQYTKATTDLREGGFFMPKIRKEASKWHTMVP